MAAHTENTSLQPAEHEAEHHIVPKRVYFAVFFALILLTWVTTGVATLDLGRGNIFVALAIAIC